MTDVVVLAAGQGTRLRPLTGDRPKSMLLVAGEPLLHHLLSDLRQCGAKRVVIVVGHGHDVIQSYVGDGSRYGLQVEYVKQPKQLGPGHALSLCRDAVRTQEFVVLPADAWYAASVLKALLSGSGPTLIQVPDASAVRHGTPVTRGKEVIDLEPMEKARPGTTHPSGGAYRVNRRILDLLAENEYQIPRAIRADIAKEDGWQAIQVPAKSYLDVTEVRDLLDLHHRLLAGMQGGQDGTIEPGVHVTGQVRIGKGSIVRSGCVLEGPVSIGENCDVGPAAVLRGGTSLRNHARVGPFTVLSDCVIGSNATIGSHNRIHRVYIDRGVQMGAGCTLLGGEGAILGADAVIGSDVRIEPNGTVGRAAQIASGRAVGQVPDQGIAL